METNYSKELISQMQKYWKKKLNKELSKNKAIEYLDNLGGPFLAFQKTPENEKELDGL